MPSFLSFSFRFSRNFMTTLWFKSMILRLFTSGKGAFEIHPTSSISSGPEKEKRRESPQNGDFNGPTGFATSSKENLIPFSYFHVALWVTIAIGAFWGFLLLRQLETANEFTRLNIFEVNAHGQGQVYGWLGLVFMGACYRKLVSTESISFPYAPLYLVLSGILLNIGGLYLFSSPLVTFFGGVCLVVATLFFCIQIYPHALRREQGSPPFLITGLVFLFLSVIYSLWHHQRIGTLEVEAQIFQQVANFQAPLRDLQIHGVALFLVVGLFADSKSWKGWACLTAGVVGEATLFILYRTTGQAYFAVLLLLPWLALLAGVVSTRLPFKLPYFWLILSLVMLLLLPIYSHLSHLRFSHAYYGAIRHAVTVGCFSQIALLIMHIREKHSSLFRLAIVFLNLGCMSRVILQILTDFHPIGYAFIPISGAIELLALITAYRSISLPSFRRVWLHPTSA